MRVRKVCVCVVLKTLPPRSPKKRGFNSLEEDGGADSERKDGS